MMKYLDSTTLRKGRTMSLASNQPSGGPETLAEMEAALLARIDEAKEVLARADGLDEEERAEIHAILEALRHDCEAHAAMFKSLTTEDRHA